MRIKSIIGGDGPDFDSRECKKEEFDDDSELTPRTSACADNDVDRLSRGGGYHIIFPGPHPPN